MSITMAANTALVTRRLDAERRRQCRCRILRGAVTWAEAAMAGGLLLVVLDALLRPAPMVRVVVWSVGLMVLGALLWRVFRTVRERVDRATLLRRVARQIEQATGRSDSRIVNAVCFALAGWDAEDGLGRQLQARALQAGASALAQTPVGVTIKRDGQPARLVLLSVLLTMWAVLLATQADLALLALQRWMQPAASIEAWSPTRIMLTQAEDRGEVVVEATVRGRPVQRMTLERKDGPVAQEMQRVEDDRFRARLPRLEAVTRVRAATSTGRSNWLAVTPASTDSAVIALGAESLGEGDPPRPGATRGEGEGGAGQRSRRGGFSTIPSLPAAITPSGDYHESDSATGEPAALPAGWRQAIPPTYRQQVVDYFQALAATRPRPKE